MGPTVQQPVPQLLRDDLPIVTKIGNLVVRIANVAEDAILANGGEKTTEDGKVVYIVQTAI